MIKHNGPTALSSVPITGDYEPDSVNQAEVFPEAVPGKGLLVSSQTEVDFGTDIATTSTITVSLVNAGDSDVSIKDIVISGSDSGLSFKGTGCSPGQILEPIEACPLTITWAPTRIGTLLDDVQVIHDGARGVLVLPVRGESTAAVSKDQGTIMLSDSSATTVVSSGGITDSDDDEIDSTDDDPLTQNAQAARTNRARVERQSSGFIPAVSNPSGVLDGLKITSFSPTRAIVAGPGGSRIVFNNEDIVLGGIPWAVNIQRNGIEFSYQGQTVLLLFDRSLSSVNRVRPQSNEDVEATIGGGTSDTSDDD